MSQASAKKPANNRPAPGTAKRLMGYILRYRWQVVVILLAIIVMAVSQAFSLAFLQQLIDKYILPLVGQANPDWQPLARAIALLAVLYVVGTFSIWLWNWMVVKVEQGTLKTIRDEMFAHQQRLPIRYFDTHEHGDVMSRYTNDTDTLRQVISQSIPQMISSLISAFASLVAMLALSACAEADGTLTLPGNLTEIGEEAFTGLEAAQTVIVPPTVTKIGARAFSGCGAVSVILPDALEDIAEDAFAEGSAIAVAKAGSKALAACAEKNIPRLSYSVEDDGVTVVKFRGDSLRVIIPAAIEGKPVKRIAAFAFEALHELAGVVIPDTVTSIGEKAFNDCYALEEADLPRSCAASSFPAASRS